ncbi:hypothetical protein FSS13T_17740 [Flavobacterium saliperosum S13]|uniref:GLPGLI family protein n=2 Tax=Flavobacterium saliperosum TaxID=329186 RepID=A0A1G4VJJ5_9FLAO|nr:hypothetical protein [Flavobacterium saliperosum]ESU25538.1 hypothetical protein FSS13T_17740 [Flavobacterium saliperosum S13]SCX07722.1 hypothetical protein SAMN02927925_01215 [Flavobacterium saliperosum]
MTKLYIAALLFSFSTVFSQKLHFDVLAKYSISYKNTVLEMSAYAISSNDNYMMRVLNLPDGQQVADVYDLKSLKKYSYKITELQSENDKIIHEFRYTDSKSFILPPQDRRYFDFESVSTTGDTEIVKMIFYKNSSKTKVRNNYELKIMKSEVNFFPLFRFMCLDGYSFLTQLNYPKAGLVTSGISKSGDAKFTLKTFEEANLEVTLPNNVNLIK